MEYENSENPYQERKDTILIWKNIANIDCDANSEILELAEEIESIGVKSKDALHLACAIFSNCEYFVTTDAKVLNKSIEGIKIINPIDFIKCLESDSDED